MTAPRDTDRLGLAGNGQHSNLRPHAAITPGLGVTLIRQDPVQPWFESIGIAKRPELAPTGDERGLHRVLGHVGVAQDPVRNRHAPIADRPGEGVEGLSVAPLCTVHERSMHPTLPLSDRSGWTQSP